VKVSARPPLRWLGGAALTGAVMALGQAPLNAWFLTLAALGFLIHLIMRSGTWRSAAWTAWAGGVGYFALALSWIVEPFMVDPVQYGWMAPFAVVLMAGGMALFWGLAGGLAVRIGKGRSDRALWFGLILTMVELARGYVFTGFPWAMIGHVWLETPLAQLSAIAGPAGLTLIACMAAALPIAFRWRGGVGAALVLVGSFAFGQYRLSLPEPPARDVTVRLVQPNAEQHLKWDAEQAEVIFRRLLTSTAARPIPDLVIWPETSVPYLFEDGGNVALAMTASAQGAPIVAGIQWLDGERVYNRMVVLGDQGRVVGHYDKSHLVPFGEYVPFGDLAFQWFGLRAFAARQGFGFTAGPGPQIIDLGPKLGKILPLICYEAVFPQDLRAPERADWILQITNDAWFGTLTGPFQHIAQARLRAVEQGLPLIRVANTGVTAVIDARGRIVADLPFGEEGFLDAQVPGALAETPYARWGEAPILLLLGGIAAMLLAFRRRGMD
jgi:apolipoprotein N-acyltransferase